MQRCHVFILVLALLGLGGSVSPATETGDPEAGRQVFRACAACHSLVPDRHMTGPSLAAIWGRKAATIEGFSRYSEALKAANVIWDEHSLDAWLADPRGFVPGNRMTFQGLTDAEQRRDLIAFLRSVSETGGGAADKPAEGIPGGMMGQSQLLDLKELEANNQIVAIGLCGDTYSVTAKTGDVYQFWEFNLRFKTDGSESGPLPGQPVIIPGGMRGDRAYVVFAAPSEISRFIEVEC
ncbi:MAG: c-type cytochrome [Paracoccaceae bacterium]